MFCEEGGWKPENTQTRGGHAKRCTDCKPSSGFNWDLLKLWSNNTADLLPHKKKKKILIRSASGHANNVVVLISNIFWKVYSALFHYDVTHPYIVVCYQEIIPKVTCQLFWSLVGLSKLSWSLTLVENEFIVPCSCFRMRRKLVSWSCWNPRSAITQLFMLRSMMRSFSPTCLALSRPYGTCWSPQGKRSNMTWWVTALGYSICFTTFWLLWDVGKWWPEHHLDQEFSTFLVLGHISSQTRTSRHTNFKLVIDYGECSVSSRCKSRHLIIWAVVLKGRKLHDFQSLFLRMGLKAIWI